MLLIGTVRNGSRIRIDIVRHICICTFAAVLVFFRISLFFGSSIVHYISISRYVILFRGKIIVRYILLTLRLRTVGRIFILPGVCIIINFGVRHIPGIILRHFCITFFCKIVCLGCLYPEHTDIHTAYQNRC